MDSEKQPDPNRAPSGTAKKRSEREARLAAALRRNLGRRKAQARGKAADDQGQKDN